jgi:hypothetical protein
MAAKQAPLLKYNERDAGGDPLRVLIFKQWHFFITAFQCQNGPMLGNSLCFARSEPSTLC